MTQKLRFAASAVGSPWWVVGTTVRRALAGSSYELELETHSFAHKNPHFVGSGDCAIGVTGPMYVAWANQRRAPYDGVAFPEFRVIAAINRPQWMAAAVVRSTGISSLAELAEQQYPWKVFLPSRGHGAVCRPVARAARAQSRADHRLGRIAAAAICRC
jgi:hypothetical protein